MDGSSAYTIDTRVVYGFQNAGKTHYILECIRNDYFYKYGTTLILCFENGKEKYDPDALRERNAYAAYYKDRQDIREFCDEQILKYHPDRIYVEMNSRLPGLRKKFSERMNVSFTVSWIEWQSMDFCLRNFRQQISQMVSESRQITFRGCPSKDLLEPYSQEFKLLNHTASYLRQDPMGFHEKAFDLFVPYSLDENTIRIGENEYLVFWLDAAEHPEHYDGKLLSFTDPLEIRRTENSCFRSAGRVVMTCCMADLQFMSFELTADDGELPDSGWVTMEAAGKVSADEYGRKVLKLLPMHLSASACPGSGMILQTGRRLNGPDPELAVRMINRFY